MRQCDLLVKEHIEGRFKNKRILGSNPLGVSKKLGVDIKEVLNTCVILEKEGLIKLQLVFNCDCGDSKIGDVNILDENCDSCGSKINEFSTRVEYKFIRK